MDWHETIEQKFNGLNELDEFNLKASESSTLYKEKMKKYHDQKIEKCNFMVWHLVRLFNSRLHLFLGKLKFKWTSPYFIIQLFPHEAVELENKEGVRLRLTDNEYKSTWGTLKRRMK